jgi:hypothetical protein
MKKKKGILFCLSVETYFTQFLYPLGRRAGNGGFASVGVDSGERSEENDGLEGEGVR